MRYTFTIKRKNVWQAFIMYCCALFYIVFLTPNRYTDRQYKVNLIPLIGTLKRFYGQGNEHFWNYYIGYWGNIFGNIILFLPFGFFDKIFIFLPA